MRLSKTILFVFALMLLSACVTIYPPIKSSRTSGPGWYTIKTSDTLYSIAWRYGLDYKQLAQWNSIDVNSPIHPGQRLKLIGPYAKVQPSTTPEKSGAVEKPKVETQTADNGSDETDDFEFRNPLKWIWPTKGKPLNTFSASNLDRRGIDIAGTSGQPVYAVADGKVVYSGNGLAGYGNLIIIKHSATYLTAYAYCQELGVVEGAVVRAGEVVAKMGQKDNTAKLHFEIRRNGKPVDPLKFLPKVTGIPG